MRSWSHRSAAAPLAAAALVWSIAACGAIEHVPPPLITVTERPAEAKATPVEAQLAGSPEPVRRFAALNHDLATTLRAAGPSCARVAAALDSWTRAHGAALRDAMSAMDAWEAVVGRRAARFYHEQMVPDVDVRVETGTRCQHDEAARAAFDRFFVVAGFDG